MSWNYRIMAFPDNPNTGWEEIYLTINDVYYDQEGNPDSYGAVGEPPTFRKGEVA